MGTQLDEHAMSLLGQRGDDGCQQDGVPCIAVPVPGIESGGVEPVAGHGRVERDRRRDRPDRGQLGHQLVVDVLHLGAVRGVPDRDPAGHDPLSCRFGQHVVQCRQLSGHRDRRGAVHRADGERVPASQPPLGRHGRQGNRGHPTPARQLRQSPGPCRDHPRRVVKGQGPGHAGGGDLTDRVPDHRGGPHPVRAPHLGE